MTCPIVPEPKIFALSKNSANELNEFVGGIQIALLLANDGSVHVAAAPGSTIVRTNGCTSKNEIFEIPECGYESNDDKSVAKIISPSVPENSADIVHRLTRKKYLQKSVAISYNLTQSSCTNIGGHEIYID